jgi:hypothetical protein
MIVVRLSSARRHQLLPVILVLACFAVAVARANPARANGGFAMAVDVQSSEVSLRAEDGSSCTWDVGNEVTVVNLTNQSLTFSAVSYAVSWTAPDGTSGVETSVGVLNDGGLTPGVTLGPNERRSFSPVVVRFTIPCRARFGDLAVRIDSPGGTGSGDAPFLAGGAPVPPGAFGALGLTALVTAGAAAGRRRRDRMIHAAASA